MKKNDLNYPMSIKRSLEFVESTALPEELPRLAFISGALEPFQAKIGSGGVINQPQARDYDPSKPQGISAVIYEKNGNPDDGYYFEIFDDDTVNVRYIFSFVTKEKVTPEFIKPETRESFAEDYTGNFQTLLNWLVAGCDTDLVHKYFEFVNVN